jgi:hypothetical protein
LALPLIHSMIRVATMPTTRTFAFIYFYITDGFCCGQKLKCLKIWCASFYGDEKLQSSTKYLYYVPVPLAVSLEDAWRHLLPWKEKFCKFRASNYMTGKSHLTQRNRADRPRLTSPEYIKANAVR